MPSFSELFQVSVPVIAALHLDPLPGAPQYAGSMQQVCKRATEEMQLFQECGVDGIIVENFRDVPFYPGPLPPEAIAALTAVARDVVQMAKVPVGVNVLRSDGVAAVSIATAVQAQFVRVNVHMGAIVSEQGIIQSNAHKTMRLRSQLDSNVLVMADIGVKHAAPLADRGLDMEARDAEERGLADVLIVSGESTGTETQLSDVKVARTNSHLPMVIGSGITPDNVDNFLNHVDGLIVGSYFHTEGKAKNCAVWAPDYSDPIDPARVRDLMTRVRKWRQTAPPKVRPEQSAQKVLDTSNSHVRNKGI